MTGRNKQCEVCGDEFYVPKWREAKGRGKFCSVDCYSIAHREQMKGIQNPAYIDGRVKKMGIKALYRTDKWRRLRKEIYKRDHYECAGCGQHGGRLEAHHIKPVGICKDPFDKVNLITLCQGCHNYTHAGGDSE